MTVPRTEDIQLPLMNILKDKSEHTFRDTLEELARQFQLTEEERNELIPSGKKKRFENRVLWAITQLRQAHFLENVERGIFKITTRGLGELDKNPSKIDNHLLKKFPEYLEFLGISIGKEKPIQEESSREESPEETIGQNYSILKKDIVVQLLNKIRTCPPEYFEHIVTELLEKMNYGIGRVIGRSGDGGIDAIIREDKLGLYEIYLQAKRWKNTVPGSEVRDFVGSLQVKNTKKGVFITTSDFSDETRKYVEMVKSNTDIVLINGEELASLMFEHGVGVEITQTYKVKKIDERYFISD